MLRFCFLIVLSLLLTFSLFAKVINYSVDESGVHIENVGPDNPMIYDNDWWSDVFDNNYLWLQAHFSQADVRGTIVSRDMWEQPNYLYPMQKCIDDAKEAITFARNSGLTNIPDITIGASNALARPESGKITETKATATPGSDLIIAEAKKASPEKPLLVFCGGPLTTVANALLLDPSIAENMIVFSLSVASYNYNGKDGWAVYVVAKLGYLVDWAGGAFWDKNSVFAPEDFANLAENDFNNDMKRLINTELGQLNQLGDGAPIVWLWDNACWFGAETKAVEFKSPATYFVDGDDEDLLVIPKEKTNLSAMRNEFFRVIELFK